MRISGIGGTAIGPTPRRAARAGARRKPPRPKAARSFAVTPAAPTERSWTQAVTPPHPSWHT